MNEQSLWITNRFGEKLEAMFRKPEGNSPYPAVLFVSGFGMDLHEYKNSFDEFAFHLVKKGIATIQFSFSGCGQSEGVYSKMTLERQADQINDMISWLGSREDIDIKHIGILAQSFGVPSTMKTNLRGIVSLCFISGAYFLKDRFMQRFEEKGRIFKKKDGKIYLSRSNDDVTVVGKGFWKNINAFDPIQEAKKITIPVCMVYGEHDVYYTAQHPESVFAAIPGKKKKYVSFPNGDHGIADVPKNMREKLLHLVTDWFSKTL